MNSTYQERVLLLERAGMHFPAVLTLPAGKTPSWRLLLIPGGGDSDVDGNYPMSGLFPHLYADLAHDLAARGYAVLRYAKIEAAWDGEKPATSLHFHDRVVVAAHALDLLCHAVSSTRQTGCIGHSEGSLIGLLLCVQRAQALQAYISLSGTAVNFSELYGVQRKHSSHNAQPEQLSSAQNTSTLSRRPSMGQVDMQYLKERDQIDPAATLAQVRCPMLIVHGEADELIPVEQAERLFQAGDATRTSKVILPHVQHFYKRVQPGMSAAETLALSGPTDEGVSDAISTWLSTLRL